MIALMSPPLEKDGQAVSPSRGSSITGSSELEQLRQKIDETDRNLLRIVAERIGLVDKIGAYKRENGLEARDEKRRAEVLTARVSTGKDLGIAEDVIRKLFEIILDYSETRENLKDRP